MLLAMVGLGVRLAFLHLGPHRKVCSRLNRNRRIEKTLLAGRGNIYDCKGQDNILALTLATKDVCADPQIIVSNRSVDVVSSELGDSLDLPTDKIAVRLNRPSRRFAYVKRFVPEPEARGISAKELPGVFFRDSTMRFYPHRSFMCHILGFVNYEGTGCAGVEQYADRYLRGSSGLLESPVNARREELYWQRGRYIPPLNGGDVCITLDQNIQYIVEKALDRALEEHRAKAAWAIVEHVRSGRILAMASRPCFDLNEFRTAGADSMLNRAIGCVYEPGSTLKVVTISAALNEGTVTPSSVFNCEHGAWRHRGRVLRDYHPYGKLTVADGLKKSSNILAAKVALTLGDRRLHQYLRKFGLGTAMGVDLPGEENGILRPTRAWSKICATRIAIGQGVAATALQILGVFCAIANDGFLMRPYVISRVSGVDGSVFLETEPEVLCRPISRETAATMRTLLRRVTEDGGTGRRARVEGYEVAGKTGTAQKPVAGGYSGTDWIASFVGFIPVSDPEFAAIVVVDEPQPLHTGGVVAAPVFQEIADQTVRYLHVPAVRGCIARLNR